MLTCHASVKIYLGHYYEGHLQIISVQHLTQQTEYHSYKLKIITDQVLIPEELHN